MTIYFEEVRAYRRKSGKCTVCGKPCTLQRNFYHTINPFNKDENGKIKDRSQVAKEVQGEATEWANLPIIHNKCQPLTNQIHSNERKMHQLQ